MKPMIKRAWVPLCLSLFFLFAHAGGVRQATAVKQQNPTGDGELHAPATAEPPEPVGVTATESMSFQLLDAKGRVLGQTHDLLCDLASGDVSYIIFDLKEADLSHKGYYPVPAGILGFDQARKSYVIDISGMEAFQNATAIGGEISPGAFIQSDINLQQINTFWVNEGVRPPTGLRKGRSLPKEPGVYTLGFRILPGGNASFRGLKGYDVINPIGHKIGKVDNLLYNPFSEKIYYLFVRFEDIADKKEIYPFPLDAFTLNFSNRTITFDLDRDLLIFDPAISTGQWEKVAHRDWIEQVHNYWRKASPVAALRRGMHIVPQTVMRETSLLGTEVFNFQNQTLGRIKDFVISSNGNIPYAITEVDDRWCFIPTTAITIDRFHRLALVDISKSRLTALSSYEPGALPDLNISDWDSEMRAFWLSELGLKADEMSPNLIISETPAMTAARKQNFLASAVREYTVRGSEGETLGDIEDLMLNMEEADAAYIVIAVGGFLDIGEKLFPIPVKAVSIMTGKDVVLNINRKMLDQAPGFSSNQWLIMESPAQREKVSDYWKNILR